MSSRRGQANNTRHRLFTAAVELFATDGYEATTVDAIAKRAGVAKGTFFVHFATKDAVVVELVRWQTTAARAARTAALPGGPVAALRATVLELGDQAGLSRELTRAVLTGTLANAELAGSANALFDTVLAEMTEDALAARSLLRRGASPEHLARGLIAAYLGAAFHFASNHRSTSMRELLAPLVDSFLEATLEKHHAKASSRSRRPPADVGVRIAATRRPVQPGRRRPTA